MIDGDGAFLASDGDEEANPEGGISGTGFRVSSGGEVGFDGGLDDLEGAVEICTGAGDGIGGGFGEPAICFIGARLGIWSVNCEGFEVGVFVPFFGGETAGEDDDERQ